MKYKQGAKPVPPCRPNGEDCPLRGSEVCHTDDCPHGWKDFVKACEDYRRYMADANRLRDITRR